MKQKLLLIAVNLMAIVASAQNFPITASRLFQGIAASGDYTIFSSNATSLTDVDKPIIFIEGYDTKNEMNGTFWYNNLLNTVLSNKLCIQLQNNGYDIIILNFTDNGTFVQRNAFLVEQLINYVNINKIGSEPNIIIGHTTGAIIGRYALAYMEANNLIHSTKLFASIDAPNKGLNVPLSFQFLVKNIAGSSTISELSSIQFGINNKMFDQLVKWNTNASGFVNSPTASFTNFFSELNVLNGNGFPKLCKNVAISNGAKTKVYNQIAADGRGEMAFSWSFFLPGNIVFNTSNNRLILRSGFGETFPESSKIRSSTLPASVMMAFSSVGFVEQTEFNINMPDFLDINGMDIAPGGYTNFFSKLDRQLRLEPNITPSADEVHEFGGTLPNTCFVPTTSALSLSSDWFYDIMNDDAIACQTTFDAFYAPINHNENSYSIPPIASNWLFDEIINSQTWNLSSNYNYGGNTDNLITKSISIKSGVKLGVNTSGPTDYVFSKNFNNGNEQNTPILGSTFTVSTVPCKTPVSITIEGGGVLQIGDGVRFGILRIRNGSQLIIKKDAKLNIHWVSKLILYGGS